MSMVNEIFFLLTACPSDCSMCDYSNDLENMVCVRCESGYVPSGPSDLCRPCLMDNCKRCSDDPNSPCSLQCEACFHGFVLAEDACVKCPDRCLGCELSGTGVIMCTECQQGYGASADKSTCQGSWIE